MSSVPRSAFRTPRSRTNPIGTGTAQLTANAPVDFVALLGKAANRFDQSRSRLALALMILGADTVDPALANQLREVCKRYYGYAVDTVQAVAHSARVAGSAELLFLITTGMVLTWFNHEEGDMRSRNNRVNTRCVARSRAGSRGLFEEMCLEPEDAV